MTLKNLTSLDAVHIPEVPKLPTDDPAWDGLSSSFKDVIGQYLDLAEMAKSLAEAYRDLWAETEALRAERDALVAQLNGEPVATH